MRLLLFIILSLCSTAVWAQQPDYGSLSHAIADCDKALETRDTVALKWLLSEKLKYGHSNGWIETKKELIENLYNGKLLYKKIEATKPEITTTATTAATRSIANIVAVMDGKQMSFRLKVLQVWVWEESHWVLFARQSVSVGKEK